MANTYTLISSNTLNSTTSTVTFSSIPSTYTDLVLVGNARVNTTTNGEVGELYFNNSSGNGNYSTVFGRGSGGGGSLAAGRVNANNARFDLNLTFDDNGNTANTFSTFELYVPNYTSNLTKQAGWFSATENNTTNAVYIIFEALYWSNTGTVSSLSIRPANQPTFGFIANSSFYLYGIKKN